MGYGLDGSRGFAQNLWNMLSEEGTWAIPRSGLIFQKRGQTFVLTGRMPWDPDFMPFTQEEWAEFQESDIAGISAMFATIGVTVLELEL